MTIKGVVQKLHQAPKGEGVETYMMMCDEVRGVQYMMSQKSLHNQYYSVQSWLDFSYS